MKNLESIAFIPDGNRRYAKLTSSSLNQIYSLGTQKAWDVIGWMNAYPGIKFGTFYTLSLENLQRSKGELAVLFKIFEHELDNIKQKSVIEEEKICLKFIGRTDLFPKKIREKIVDVEKFTFDNNKKIINVAFGYNGQVEIVDAAKKLALDYAEKKIDLDAFDVNDFKKYLYSDFSDPDLIIRTGQNQRLSGFLTYQSAYSELYFSSKYWPEFNELDLRQAIDYYNLRQRNFGK